MTLNELKKDIEEAMTEEGAQPNLGIVIEVETEHGWVIREVEGWFVQAGVFVLRAMPKD